MSETKSPQTLDQKIRSRIYGHGRGWVFTQKHFQDLGPSSGVESGLRRFHAEGGIRRLTRGLYDYPVKHPILGEIAPSADAIANALIDRDAIRVQPSGAYAANVLGLSEQVPARVVFLTDGPNRKVKIGRQEILLKHTTPKNMATAGRKSGTVIQALRYLGQEHVDGTTLAILERHLTPADRSALKKDLRYAPAWIAEALLPLTAPLAKDNPSHGPLPKTPR